MKNISRRQFFKFCVCAAVATPVVATVAKQTGLSWFAKIKLWWNRRQTAKLISAALDSPEGRAALAQAMVEPIRRSLEYQSLGRRLMMLDELPQGAYPRYKKDVRATATVL